MSKIPVIIDCDPGTDDAVAIWLAEASDKLDLVAITPVAGNVPYKYTSVNAALLAGYTGSKCRVSKGADKPLIFRPEQDASDAHGENGLGGLILENRTGVVAEDVYAWDMMYEEAKKHSGELVICAVGPLTNVAIAVLKYPDLKDHVKRIQIMGGAFTAGNMTPYAEYNIWFDPHACEIVLRSGIPITLCGLDCTVPAKLTSAELREICAGEHKMKELMDGICDFVDAIENPLWKGTITIHDAITVAGLIDETLFETKPYHVVCETRGINAGQTVVDFRNHLNGPINCDVAYAADKEKFKAILKEALEYFR